MEIQEPMAYCDHEFAPDAITKEVRCVKCGNFDDEMQLPLVRVKKRAKLLLRLRRAFGLLKPDGSPKGEVD